MNTKRNIIALIDGSNYTRSVCEHAAWVANRINASVHVIHALGRRQVSSEPANFSGSIGLGARTALLDELAELDRQKAKLAQKRGRAILEDTRQCLKNAGVEDIETNLRLGELVDTVLEMEEDAQFVVIGKRGEAADFDQLHLGSNLERIARASKKPILVTSREFKPIERMVIAFDGGKSVMKAIDYLINKTVFTDLECHLLSAGADNKEHRRQIEGAAAMLKDVGYTVSSEIKPGEPETIIAKAVETEGFDLLVMGAYGHSRIRNLIIGSTTTSMLQDCHVPVILAR